MLSLTGYKLNPPVEDNSMKIKRNVWPKEKLPSFSLFDESHETYFWFSIQHPSFGRKTEYKN